MVGMVLKEKNGCFATTVPEMEIIVPQATLESIEGNLEQRPLSFSEYVEVPLRTSITTAFRTLPPRTLKRIA